MVSYRSVRWQAVPSTAAADASRQHFLPNQILQNPVVGHKHQLHRRTEGRCVAYAWICSMRRDAGEVEGTVANQKSRLPCSEHETLFAGINCQQEGPSRWSFSGVLSLRKSHACLVWLHVSTYCWCIPYLQKNMALTSSHSICPANGRRSSRPRMRPLARSVCHVHKVCRQFKRVLRGLRQHRDRQLRTAVRK